MFIDDVDDNSTDIQAFLRTIDDSTSTIKGHFRVSNRLNADDFAIFTIDGSITEATGYFKVPCTRISGATSFSNGEDIIVTFARTGDKGDSGAQGAVGAQGAQGVQGADGAQGAQGVQGASGDAGSVGAQGAQGVQGAQGRQGATGAQGSDGAQGNQGVQGAVGAQGAQGAQGFQGRQGSVGAQGDAGTVGSQGAQGAQGFQGRQGAAGVQGAQGAQGFQGVVGAQGANGVAPWAQDAVGLSTITQLGVNTTGLAANTELVGIGNSFQGVYISNGMYIMDNKLTGNHYIGTAFNGLMAGPVDVQGSLTIDGVWVVV